MTKDEKLAKLQRSFEDWSLAMNVNRKNGKMLVGLSNMEIIMKELGQLVKVLREDE